MFDLLDLMFRVGCLRLGGFTRDLWVDVVCSFPLVNCGLCISLVLVMEWCRLVSALVYVYVVCGKFFEFILFMRCFVC